MNSGSVHVVDDMCYDIIEQLDQFEIEEHAERLEDASVLESVKSALKENYPEAEIEEALEDIKELAKAGQLFTKLFENPVNTAITVLTVVIVIELVKYFINRK